MITPFNIAMAMIILSMGISIQKMIKEKSIFNVNATWYEVGYSLIILIGANLLIWSTK